MAMKSFSGINGGKVVGWIIGILVTIVIITAVCFYCANVARRAIASVQTASAPPVSQPHHAVQVWEGDVPSMEKFLQEVIKEKLGRFTAQQLCAFTSNY
ncbi:hypothetical protein SLEP1_g45813 [Rubroshorea leprosula]|uniref:Uncharacterized protein n=1 Tax=Rubroshorea leprosula TaxID=152421 RepID=A0AAV5LK80_9ROSI|nr:hypothetical protein SLEP1_g45813 [Rubroshorea leprosula]